MKAFKETLCRIHLSVIYEEKGGFSKIDGIVKRHSQGEDLCDKYFSYNLFLSMCMQGIIDVVWTDSGIRWVVGQSVYLPDEDRCFAFAEELLREDIQTAKVYFKSVPIGYVKSCESEISPKLDDFCSIGEITDHVVTEISLSSIVDSEFDIYSFTDWTWKQEDFVFNQSALMRQRDRYFGYNYFLYVVGYGKALRINDIEWLFIVGSYLLNIDFKKVLAIDGDLVCVRSSFRLPSLILRFLYCNSISVRLDYMNEFKLRNRETMCDLYKYLTPGSM